MPHNRKRASIQPRFLIDSPANGVPPPNMNANKAKSSSKLPVDIQIFRLMGTTVANSAKEYPLLFPDFVSHFIASNSDDSETGDAKLRSWKIISELNQLKQKQQFQQEAVEAISQHIVAETTHEKSSTQVSESTSSNSLSSFLNSPTIDQRNAQQLLVLAQAKVSGGKKLLGRSMTFKDGPLLPQSLVVGGRSISRPNTPGVPVPFVKGIASNRANSISAAAAPATSKALTTPVYAQLLNSAPTLSSTAIPNSNGLLTHKHLPVPDFFQRSLQLSSSFGGGDQLTSSGSNISNHTSMGIANSLNGNASANNTNGNDARNQISAVAAIAFSRNIRLNNTIATNTRSTCIKPVPVALASSHSSFSSTRYVDPLYGINNPTSCLLSDLYRRRISEITLFAEQTIRFEQRKANRMAAHRSVTGAAGVQISASSAINNFGSVAPSPTNSPLGKYLQRTMSPIEPRRSVGVVEIGDQQHFSDEEDEDDSDTS